MEPKLWDIKPVMHQHSSDTMRSNHSVVSCWCAGSCATT